jgi:hypothetical protein
MRGTDETAAPWDGIEDLVRDSLLTLSGVYERRPDGSLQFSGRRPAGGWHGHGWLSKTITVLVGGTPRKVLLHKHRWLLVGTTTTCHSRPPDDPRLLRFCTLIVVLRVWAFINSMVGFHSRTEVLPDLGEGHAGSDRSVQRWTGRMLASALEIQQAIRAAILSMRRSEPRPEEDWFRGGLSPPPRVAGRCWTSPTQHQTLWRAFAMLFVGAKELGTDVSLLLAEARRRLHTQDDSLPI